MQSALLLQWVVRLCKASEQEKWTFIPKRNFAPFSAKYTCFFANVKSSEFRGLNLIKSPFWKTVLKTWLDHNKHGNLAPTVLWNNQFIQYHGNVLFYSQWIKGGILKVSDMYNDNGLLSCQEICHKIGNTPSRVLEYNVVASAVRNFVDRVREDDRIDIDLSFPPPFCEKNVFNYTCKDFRKALCLQAYSTPCASRFWMNKLQLKLDKSVWETPRLCTRETRLRVLQWKILHNIYPTNIMLNKMRVKENNKCSYCTDEVDFIEHFYFYCPVVFSFWGYISQHILAEYNVRCALSAPKALFGIQRDELIDKLTLKKINHIILLAKMCISIYKKKPQSQLPLPWIFENQKRIRKV